MSFHTTPNSSKELPPFHATEPNLPQELADVVIDHLHDDEATLRVCGVVCRSWASSARYHLFDTINIKCSSLCNTKKYHRLLIYLERSPQLASYVRDLTVDHTSWCIGLEEAEVLVGAICNKLHNVKTLTLQRVHISALSDHLRESLCSLLALPTLRTLSLVEFSVRAFSEFVTLLTMTIDLQRLMLFQIRWEDRGGIEGSGGFSSSSAQGLGQTSSSNPPSNIPKLCIRELKLGGVSYRSSRSLLNFLGGSVEDFELDDIFGHHRFEVDKAAEFIALECMTSLRTLRLNPNQSIMSSPGSWVISLLSSLRPSNCLETLLIRTKEFHLKSMPGLLDWEWYKVIDETLSPSSFPKLRVVDVKVISIGPNDIPETRDFKELFPQLRSRGIFRAHFQYRGHPTLA